jgi:curved DNA-binding protein CbpA
MSEDRFIDHYEVLQVDRNADPETVERVFRLLAKRYHPDNPRTGDPDRFKELNESYRILSDPHDRAAYDASYESEKEGRWSLFVEAPAAGADEDDRMQRWILSLLYKERRRGTSDPGMGPLELERYLEVPDGQLDFHIWYLKEKGWLMRTETGKYAITVDGVDWIREQDQLLRKDRLIEESTSDSSPGDSSDSSPAELPESVPSASEGVRDEESAP